MISLTFHSIAHDFPDLDTEHLHLHSRNFYNADFLLPTERKKTKKNEKATQRKKGEEGEEGEEGGLLVCGEGRGANSQWGACVPGHGLP